MEKVEFTLNGIKTNVLCSKDDQLKDICRKFATKAQKDFDTLYFIYNGNKLNMELSFNQQANQIDKERNEMSVLVNEKTNTVINENKAKSKEIICPKCGEACLINFNNYKIKLFECKNNHETNNILINDYNNTQIINENNIICGICNKYNKSITYNKQFYKCLTCNKNLCPICKSNHSNNHKIIDYSNINYVCEIHNDLFYSYCKNCKVNLCIKCKSKHNNKHEIINYENILPDDDEIREELAKFRQKIDKLNEDINEIIKMLKKISENMEIYYNINNELLNNYELQKRNYHILKNVNFIKTNIKINDIEDIINSNDILHKFNNLFNLYNSLINNNKYNKGIDKYIKNDDYKNNKNDKQSNSIIMNNDDKVKTNENNELNNEIILKYKIDKTKIENNKIQIFGENFVVNNKDNNCTIFCEGKKYNLSQYFNLENYNNNKDVLIIRQRNINNITDITYMFSNCSLLFSISENISNLDITKFNSLCNMFDGCILLKVLPDISK